MNKRDYAALEREFVSSRISLRELCRRHHISAHSSVVTQARKLKWQEKREAYQAKASEAFIEKHADRMAERQAQIRDKILDAIDVALDKFSADMLATKSVRQPDGSITEEAAWLMKPRDAALLIDRLMVLFERPAHINEGRDLNVKSELPLEALQQFVELTQERAAPPTSPLPRTPRTLDD